MDLEQRLAELETLNKGLETTVEKHEYLQSSSCHLAAMAISKVTDLSSATLTRAKGQPIPLLEMQDDGWKRLQPDGGKFDGERGLGAYEERVKERCAGFVAAGSLDKFETLAEVMRGFEKKIEAVMQEASGHSEGKTGAGPVVGIKNQESQADLGAVKTFAEPDLDLIKHRAEPGAGSGKPPVAGPPSELKKLIEGELLHQRGAPTL